MFGNIRKTVRPVRKMTRFLQATYDVRTQDTVTILTVAGDFDFASVGLFATIADLAKDPVDRLVISLDRCTFCDASALSMLVRVHKAMRSLIVVVPETAECRRVFQITGLIKMLQIVPTLELALRLDTVAA